MPREPGDNSAQSRVFIRLKSKSLPCNTVMLHRHHAEGVKTTAETVKQALVDAKTAQMSAEKAIARARADIGDTETRLAMVQNQRTINRATPFSSDT